MSQLLDSLRRASRFAPSRDRHAPKRVGAEAILATMEHASAQGRGSSVLIPALIALVIGLGAVCWFMLGWHSQPATGAAAVRPPSATPPPQPAPTSPPKGARVDPPPAKPADRPALSAPEDPPSARIPRAPAEPRHRRTTPEGLFHAALESHRSGDFETAEKAYRSLLERGVMPAQVHNNLGLLLEGRGRLDEAARELERATAVDPDYAKAHNNLGVVQLALGRLDEAVAALTRAVDLDPRDPDAIINLALAEKASGHPELAKESLLRALGLAPQSAPAHYNLAVLYDQTGEPGLAAGHYRAFLEHSGGGYAARAADVRARLEALERDR